MPDLLSDHGLPGQYAVGALPVLGTQALSSNRAYLARFQARRSLALTLVAFEVTAFTAGDTADPAVDVGIYDRYLNRVASTGAVTGKLNSTGIKTVALAARLAEGQVYYAALAAGSLGTSAVTLRALAASAANVMSLFGTGAPLVESAIVNTAHPLPNPMPALSANAAAILLALRES